MILDSQIIEFQGMPLFQKARFRTPMDMQGSFAEFACFFYMVEGNMLSFDARGVNRLGEKEAVIKNCNNYVQRYVPNSGEEECEAIAVYLYPALLKSIYKDEMPGFLKPEHDNKPRKILSNELIEQYMGNLAIYFESADALDDDLGILKLKELMMILLKSENHESIRKLFIDIFTPVNVEFKEAVEQNIFNPLSLEQLAFICKMSLSTFKREFKKLFDDTPARYIKNRRLDHAASLLLQSQEPIAAIAYDSGFQDPSTFSASFQQRFKVSPKNYRLSQMRS